MELPANERPANAFPADEFSNEPERQADKEADEMKDQLRKEVAVWNAERNDSSARQVAESGMTAAARTAPQPAKKAKRAKPAVASVVQPTGTAKKPFAMSFDGVTDAQHISYMIARGAR
jgi:hypothetical protein